MPTAETLLTSEFASLPDIIRAHGAERGHKLAIVTATARIDYRTLDGMMDRVAAALQRAGVARNSAVAIVAAPSIAYAALFLGALRAGCAATPIAPSATPDQIAAMVADSGAPLLFVDAAGAEALADADIAARQVRLDDSAGGTAFTEWLVADGAMPEPVTVVPDDPFNIIYSSGTTGTPKGIVQSHKMRWAYTSRNARTGFADAVTMIATPLYSNTTLVSFLPTLAYGGTVVLMPKFDARGFLELAAAHKATHAMLVPVQYARIMAVEDFDSFDLSHFRLKTSTSAPFAAGLKADIVARWPGKLVEYYGMTEGGGSAILDCSEHPDKLHTVGLPAPGHDIRLIDDDGKEVSPGEAGEVVGRSGTMMTGYHNRGDASAAAEWFDADGNRFIRHGDIGRFDEDGFLTLVDRKKDMIISGGFNIYPSDLEAVLREHAAVADCAVIGVPSKQWGETPVAFYVPADGGIDSATILAWFNDRVGKTQRLAALEPIAELPRSAIGKVLKRDLRDHWAGCAA